MKGKRMYCFKMGGSKMDDTARGMKAVLFIKKRFRSVPTV